MNSFFLLVYKPEERVPFVRDYFQRWINIKFNNIGTLLQSHRIRSTLINTVIVNFCIFMGFIVGFHTDSVY